VGVKVGELLTISVVQTAILLAIAVILGQWAARKLGLGTPLIAAFLARRSVPERSLSMLVVALALGIATALALMGRPRLFSGSLHFAACFWSFHT